MVIDRGRQTHPSPPPTPLELRRAVCCWPLERARAPPLSLSSPALILIRNDYRSSLNSCSRSSSGRLSSINSPVCVCVDTGERESSTFISGEKYIYNTFRKAGDRGEREREIGWGVIKAARRTTSGQPSGSCDLYGQHELAQLSRAWRRFRCNNIHLWQVKLRGVLKKIKEMK